ncbi:MAG: invasion associated locus B family protein [Rhodospirillaceae bacterium]
MRRNARSIILMSCVVGTLAGAAIAAETKGNPDFGPEGVWNASCDIDRMTDVKTCRLVTYRMFEDGQTTSYVALSVIPTGNDYQLFMTANQGLVQNCALRVDRSPRAETQIATLNMCMFPNFVGSRLLDQFKNGTTILARMSFVRAGRRDIDFTLSGFSRAFDEMVRSLQ